MRKHLSKLKPAVILIGGLFAFLLSSCGQMLNEDLHGTNLSSLSDDLLFEAVYFQNFDLVESFPDEETALSQLSSARRTVYILSIYDMEIQNGGLCQFFVNPSRSLAPYVEECLEAVGAEDHQQLFTEFVTDNEIDVQNLDSFKISSVEEYAAQTQRYDFETFDHHYVALTPLHNWIVAYIRANIQEF